jgi:hypothetical protein
VYFAFVQPPQGGGSTRVGGLTVYHRSSRPCRITGLVRLTALDASGQSIPLRGTGSSGPIGMTGSGCGCSSSTMCPWCAPSSRTAVALRRLEQVTLAR